jgi:hypothetical protein
VAGGEQSCRLSALLAAGVDDDAVIEDEGAATASHGVIRENYLTREDVVKELPVCAVHAASSRRA